MMKNICKSSLLSILIFSWLVPAGLSAVNDKKDIAAQFRANHQALLKAHAHIDNQQVSKRREHLHQPIDVEHYNLSLNIDPDTAYIKGENIISLRARDNLSKVAIDLSEYLELDQVLVDGQQADAVRHDDQIIITLTEPALANDNLIITIAYQGHPMLQPPYNTGLIFSRHAGRPVVASVSEPYSAPAWWPCIDDSQDKATIELAISVPADLIAVANGKLQQVSDNNDGSKTYYWREDYPIATYLVAVAAANYQQVSASVSSETFNQMPLNFYLYPEDQPAAEPGLTVLQAALPIFAKLFGDYPFSADHYGMVEIPWLGAMENQTIAGLGAGVLRQSPESENVIAHELAHQWWGDSITVADWHDIWLNEGFATYAEALFQEYYHNYPIGLLMAGLDDGSANGRLAGTVSAPDADNPFADPAAIYDKGAWVLHMLRHVIGDENFFQALQNYGARYQYQNATTKDFQKVCEEVSGGNLGWFFQEWIYTPARPIYSYRWQTAIEQGKWELSVAIKQQQTQLKVYRMPIDLKIEYTDGSFEYRRVLNNKREQAFHFQLDRPPLAVKFDADNWLLKEMRIEYTSPIAVTN